MANIDLSGYNLAELKGLQFDIEKEIKNRQQQDVKKAREQILEIAQNMGISVEELLAKGTGTSKKAGSGAKVNPQ
jgi:DNA-binding protein H-NS